MADGALSNGYDLIGAYNYDLTASKATEFTTTTTGDNAFQEIVASLPRECDLIEIQQLSTASGTIHNYGLNIAIGGAGSEDEIISDILGEGKSVDSEQKTSSLLLPFHIPSGQRVSYMIDSSAASRVVGIGFRLWAKKAGGKVGYKNAFSEGFNTRAGIAVDPGGTANTKGSWVEITAATAQKTKGLLVCTAMNQNSATTSASFLFDIAIGGSGAEQFLIQNIGFTSGSLEEFTPYFYFDVEIPSGTRIAARGQSSITDATDRVFSISLVGFN
jgi:hypothetical protein